MLHKSFTIIVVLGITSILAACKSPSTSAPQGRILRAGPDLVSAEWLTDDTIVIQRDLGDTVLGTELWAIDLRTTAFFPLGISEDRACEQTSRHVAHTLEGNRILYTLLCHTIWDENEWYLYAYDYSTGTTEQIFDYQLNISSMGTGSFAWNEESQTALTGKGALFISEQLFRMDPNGQSAVETGLEQAFWPAFSPNNSTVAFVGSEQRGRHLDSDQLYTLYITDAEFSLLQPISTARGLIGPVWTPDGKHIITLAEMRQGLIWEYGLWSINVRTQDTELLFADFDVGPISFSPNGMHLLATDFEDGEYQILLFEAEQFLR